MAGTREVVAPAETPAAPGLTLADPLTLEAPINFVHGIAAMNEDGTANFIVEIPSGTNQKWEVMPNGKLEWDKKKGVPRTVAYMPYPGNYGAIPRTMEADGELLDLIALAPAYARGSVVPVRVIGVLVMKDDGEQDNKLLGVVPGTPLGDVKSLKELNDRFLGALEIVRTFFSYYKGPDGGGMLLEDVGDEVMARQLIDESVARYDANQGAASQN